MAQGDFPGVFITPDTKRPFTTTKGAETSTQVDIWKQGDLPNLFATEVKIDEMNDSIVNNPLYANLTITNSKSGIVNKRKVKNRRGATGVPHDDLYPVNATPMEKAKILITKFGDIDVWDMEAYSTMEEVIANSEPSMMRRGVIQSIDDMVLFGINKVGYSEYEGIATVPNTISDVATKNTSATAEDLLDAILSLKQPVLVVQNEAALLQLKLQVSQSTNNSAIADTLATALNGIKVAFYRDMREVITANGGDIKALTTIPFFVYEYEKLATAFNPSIELLYSQDATLEKAQLNGGAEQVVSLYQRGKMAWRATAFGGYDFNGNSSEAFTNIDLSGTPSAAGEE